MLAWNTNLQSPCNLMNSLVSTMKFLHFCIFIYSKIFSWRTITATWRNKFMILGVSWEYWGSDRRMNNESMQVINNLIHIKISISQHPSSNDCPLLVIGETGGFQPSLIYMTDKIIKMTKCHCPVLSSWQHKEMKTCTIIKVKHDIRFMLMRNFH